MAAKTKKQHGFRVVATLFVPYDPSDPATIQAASETAKALAERAAYPKGVEIEKTTDPVAAAIPALVPAT